MAVDTKSELVVDRSAHGELLRMNFNISFPALSCEFATLDVSDALGTVRRWRLACLLARCICARPTHPEAVLSSALVGLHAWPMCLASRNAKPGLDVFPSRRPPSGTKAWLPPRRSG